MVIQRLSPLIREVTLTLTGASANFFKREGLFESPYYKFLSEDSNGDIEMTMTYNSDIEVVKLVQQWLPFIHVVNNSEEAESIIQGIERNYKEFFSRL